MDGLDALLLKFAHNFDHDTVPRCAEIDVVIRGDATADIEFYVTELITINGVESYEDHFINIGSNYAVGHPR